MPPKHASYRYDVDSKGAPQRLTMNIAMNGAYIDLRNALHAIAHQPLVRIEQLSISRQHITTDKVDVNMRISLLGANS